MHCDHEAGANAGKACYWQVLRLDIQRLPMLLRDDLHEKLQAGSHPVLTGNVKQSKPEGDERLAQLPSPALLASAVGCRQVPRKKRR